MSPAMQQGSADDTIFALASGAGRGAIAILRLSGAATSGILARLGVALPAPRLASLRGLRDGSGGMIDRALVLWLPGPASYTGEDMAELHLHGGRAVLAAATQALLAAGARPADPGEFTRRAFLAGRMDLLECEAVADLVEAETDGQRLQALRQLQGAVVGSQSLMLAGWAERLRKNLAFQEALIDFPDENLPMEVEQGLIADVGALLESMRLQVDRAARGERLRQGLVFAIIGAPNVGKSSLLNVLARRDIAIVSPIPGTTRDVLEGVIDIEGIAVTLIDTAGLRQTEDVVEAEGVRRARARAESADLVLYLVDAGNPGAAEAAPGGALVIANKIDLAPPPAGALGISVKTGAGLAELERRLAAAARGLAHAGAEPVLTRARHAAALRDAVAALEGARDQEMAELRAEELRLALRALGRITGTVDAEAVLDSVFGSFCIGK